MGTIVTSIIAAALLAAGVSVALSWVQRPTYEARTLPSVRLDEPGENLVGRDWSGWHPPTLSVTRISQQRAESPDRR